MKIFDKTYRVELHRLHMPQRSLGWPTSTKPATARQRWCALRNAATVLTVIFRCRPGHSACQPADGFAVLLQTQVFQYSSLKSKIHLPCRTAIRRPVKAARVEVCPSADVLQGCASAGRFRRQRGRLPRRRAEGRGVAAQLARIQDVVRVQGALDGGHHAQRPRAVLRLQMLQLPVADPVLACEQTYTCRAGDATVATVRASALIQCRVTGGSVPKPLAQAAVHRGLLLVSLTKRKSACRPTDTNRTQSVSRACCATAVATGIGSLIRNKLSATNCALSLTGAGAAHAVRERHHVGHDPAGAVHLGGVGRVQDEHDVEVAIACVADQRCQQPRILPRC